MPKSSGHAGNPEREAEVRKLHAEGKLTMKEIAEKVGVSEGTISYYIYKKAKKGKKKNVHGNSHGKNSHSTKNSNHADLPPEVEIQQAHASGRIEELLRGYAASSGVPFATFAIGVAESLRTTANRELLRMPNSLSALRRNAAV